MIVGPISLGASWTLATARMVLPAMPSATASIHQRLSFLPVVTRSKTPEAMGAEPKETTVPTATPAKCMEL